MSICSSSPSIPEETFSRRWWSSLKTTDHFNKPADDDTESYQIDHSLHKIFVNAGGRIVDFFSNQVSAQDVANKILKYHKFWPLEPQQAPDPLEAASLAPTPKTAWAK